VTVAELLERLAALEPDPDWPVAVDLARTQLVPVVDVTVFDVPALVITYDEDGSLRTKGEPWHQ
jgi:hypothetical protein